MKKIIFFISILYTNYAICDADDIAKLFVGLVVLEKGLDLIDNPRIYYNWERGNFQNTVDKSWEYNELIDLTDFSDSSKKPDNCEGEFKDELPVGPVECYYPDGKLRFKGNFEIVDLRYLDYDIYNSSSTLDGITEAFDLDGKRIFVQKRDEGILKFAEGNNKYYKYLDKYFYDYEKGLIKLTDIYGNDVIEARFKYDSFDYKINSGEIRSAKIRILNSLKIYDLKGRLKVSGEGNRLAGMMGTRSMHKSLTVPYHENWILKRYFKNGATASLVKFIENSDITETYTKGGILKATQTEVRHKDKTEITTYRDGKGTIEKKIIKNPDRSYSEEKYKFGVIYQKEFFSPIPPEIRKQLRRYERYTQHHQRDKKILYFKNGNIKEIIGYRSELSKLVLSSDFILKEKRVFNEQYRKDGTMKKRKIY